MNNIISIVDRKDAVTLCVASANGVGGSGIAFNKLESKLPSLKGRRFYGVLFGNPDTGIYRACVELTETDSPKIMGLELWTIPGGRYARAKIKDWEKNTNLIGKTFGEIAKLYPVDESRPAIEYYRSQKELILFSPVKINQIKSSSKKFNS